jgi:hypothetical protein
MLLVLIAPLVYIVLCVSLNKNGGSPAPEPLETSPALSPSAAESFSTLTSELNPNTADPDTTAPSAATPERGSTLSPETSNSANSASCLILGTDVLAATTSMETAAAAEMRQFSVLYRH